MLGRLILNLVKGIATLTLITGVAAVAMILAHGNPIWAAAIVLLVIWATIKA